MGSLEQCIEEIKSRYGNKLFFNFREAEEITGLKKDALYDLLADGHLVAHNPGKAPGKKGTRIMAFSVWDYLRNGVIPAEKWCK